MTDAEELFNNGMKLLEDGNYYDAMTNFTNSYNADNNTRALFYSGEASFQMAMFYFKGNSHSGWESFSRNALQKFERCIEETTSHEIGEKAKERISKIKELQGLAKEFE